MRRLHPNVTLAEYAARVLDARIDQHFDRGGKCGCSTCIEHGWSSRKGRRLFRDTDGDDHPRVDVPW